MMQLFTRLVPKENETFDTGCVTPLRGNTTLITQYFFELDKAIVENKSIIYTLNYVNKKIAKFKKHFHYDKVNFMQNLWN